MVLSVRVSGVVVGGVVVLSVRESVAVFVVVGVSVVAMLTAGAGFLCARYVAAGIGVAGGLPAGAVTVLVAVPWVVAGPAG